MTWMSHECLSKVHWSETKSHLPIVTGKTTWCPASYKRIISLFPTLHKHWFCCGHIQTLCLPKEVRGSAGGQGSAWIGVFLLFHPPSCCILSTALWFFVFLPWLRSFAVSQGVSAWLVTFRVHSRAGCATCILATQALTGMPDNLSQNNLLERADDKYFESAVSQPFSVWISTDHHKVIAH